MNAGPLTAEQIIELLSLEPLEFEGGWYAETWRSADQLEPPALPPRFRGRRAAGSAIYYFLTPTTFSSLHRLPADEIFHFYLGDPVEMLQLHPDGSGGVVTLGTDLAAGARPQIVVPAGTWQGSRLVAGGRLALLGCTLAPGFDPADFEAGRRAALSGAYPAWQEMIEALSPR